MPKALLRRIGKRLDQIHPSIFHAIKLAAFPFNKYGMVNGHVEYVSPDAAELPDTREHAALRIPHARRAGFALPRT